MVRAMHSGVRGHHNDGSARSAATSSARVCVIGAGTSGLVSAKALLDRGIPFTCFEESDRVGGLWVFGNKNGRGGAYRSLHINTSRDRMQFRDYPMPRHYPDYPGHALIADYLASYAEHFGLVPHVRFQTPVRRVEPTASGGYRVELATGERCEFSAIVVANGHHWSPRYPEPPLAGTFDGIELHSHHYVAPDEPHDLRGQNVVVVGFGNSAVDIACELARDTSGGRVFLSVRRGAWVLPKYALGKPLDEISRSRRVAPRWIARGLAELWYRFAVGDLRRFGLPAPDHRLGDAHPTVSNDLLGLLGAGRVFAKPHIVARQGRRVRFADGSEESIDAIVYATGYDVSFPFFDADWLRPERNELPLYLRVFHPRIDGLYFIGLCQPLGPIMPIAEAQAKLVAAHLAGEYRLPASEVMLRETARERERMRARFGDSPRHTMQLDFDEYLARLARERRKNHRRDAQAVSQPRNSGSA